MTDRAHDVEPGMLLEPAAVPISSSLHARFVARAADEQLVDVAFTTLDTRIGPLLLAASPDGLLRVAFALEGFDAVLAELADAVSPRVLRMPRRLDDAAQQLEAYLDGRLLRFDLPLDLSLARGFRREVLQHLCTIPYGRTESYTVAARAAGRPNAVRAAAGACSHNPIPLVIPCHRVVRSDGSFGAYRGGATLKRDLLEMGIGRMSTASGSTRVDGLAWDSITDEIGRLGWAPTDQVLTDEECDALVGLYDVDARFRSTVDMARHRFGAGEYRYFAHPLPAAVAALRAAYWPHLLRVARAWYEQLGRPTPWPDDLDHWLARCHCAGQDRPTPLLLRYGPGDWNALHRDLYGELVFPLQMVVGLDRPDADYTGGEFVVVEQRARAQSRATSITIPRGHAVVFTTRDRPVRSARGWSAAPMRHGLSTVRSGRRHALGLIFHDAA